MKINFKNLQEISKSMTQDEKDILSIMNFSDNSDEKKQIKTIIKNLQKYAIKNKCEFTHYNNIVHFEERNFTLNFKVLKDSIEILDDDFNFSAIIDLKDFIKYQSFFLEIDI